MMPGTLARYFGFRFLGMVIAVFCGLFALVLMVDFVEMLRRTSGLQNASASTVLKITLFRVPHITERILPFAVLTGAMVCYLSLSRRLELVVARAAGVSAWQFLAPAIVVALVLGILGTTIYNPIAAVLRDQSQRLESELFGGGTRSFHDTGSGFWVRQKSADGQAIINAKESRQQGIELTGVSVFRLDEADVFLGRIEAKKATLHNGYWRLEGARVYYIENRPPEDHEFFDLSTSLTRAQVQESFATPETVPFWQLSSFIQLAESANFAAAGYRLQYYQLLALPLYLAAMVLLAAAVSLRLFRFGGVQKMVMGGVAGGFLLYVLSKITGDLSKAGLISAVVAAGLPPFAGGLTAVTALLYQEDG
jgi:lipopolysaccharide export system permease protein